MNSQSKETLNEFSVSKTGNSSISTEQAYKIFESDKERQKFIKEKLNKNIYKMK